MISKTNYIAQINKNEIFNMSRFIVSENFMHHAANEIPDDIEDEINSVYNEEMAFVENSKIFAVKNNLGNILGTIRVLKWDFINPLPIEKLFGINPLLCTKERTVNEIWHIGRFAINKKVGNLRLFKNLMVSAIAPICEHKDNFAFAEVDAKLLRVLSLMGIKTSVVGESIDYLGSETIPVMMSYAGLIDFYNKNKNLIYNDAFKEIANPNVLHNRVVFEA